MDGFSARKTANIGHKRRFINKKEKFYNPIWQNSGHIKELHHFLGDSYNDLPMYSIIVFGKQATLKFKEPFQNVKVIKSRELRSVIKKEPGENRIFPYDRKNIHQLLLSTYIKDKKKKRIQKKEHVATIKKQHTNVSANNCPRCGGSLVTRKGKYGEFKGCSNYPKCRFTA